MCVGWTKVGILCREVRVGLFEKMRFEQTFEGSGHEEFSTCRGQPVQAPQGENMPEIVEKKKKRVDGESNTFNTWENRRGDVGEVI